MDLGPTLPYPRVPVSGGDEVAMDLGPTLPYPPDMAADGALTEDPSYRVYCEVSPIADGSKELVIESRYNFKV